MQTLLACKGQIRLSSLIGSVVVCAALSTHAGRNQRSLPDKRARRKPGWLDNTVDPKQAAQLALHQAAPDVSLDATLLCHRTCCSPSTCKPCCCCALLLLLCSAAAAVLCCCCCALLLLCSAAAVLCFRCCALLLLCSAAAAVLCCFALLMLLLPLLLCCHSAAILLLGNYDISTLVYIATLC